MQSTCPVRRCRARALASFLDTCQRTPMSVAGALPRGGVARAVAGQVRHDCRSFPRGGCRLRSAWLSSCSWRRSKRSILFFGCRASRCQPSRPFFWPCSRRARSRWRRSATWPAVPAIPAAAWSAFVAATLVSAFFAACLARECAPYDGPSGAGGGRVGGDGHRRGIGTRSSANRPRHRCFRCGRGRAGAGRFP